MEVPNDVLEGALLMLKNAADVCRFSMVSRYWYFYLRSESFWRSPACSGHILCYIDDCERVCWVKVPDLDTPSRRGQPEPKIYKKKLPGFQHLQGSQVYTSSSHDILFAGKRKHEESGLESKIDVFDSFKLYKHIFIDIPQKILKTDEVVKCIYATWYQSTDNYLLALTIQRGEGNCRESGLLVYQSATKTWARSGSLGIQLYSPDTCIGNYLYFRYDVSIYKYSVAENSWSVKEFRGDGMCMGSVSKALFQSDGKLMLAVRRQYRFSVWLLHEEEERYSLSLLSDYKAPIFPFYALVLFTCEHDLLAMHLYGSGGVGRYTVVYYPKRYLWKFFKRPLKFDNTSFPRDLYKNSYFISKTDMLFISARGT